MKLFALISVFILLLSGCAAPALPPETTEASSTPETTAAIETTVEETTVPVTETTSAPDPLELLLESLTTEEKVGQLFLARCPSTSAIEDIEKYHLGGYILFGHDFENETPDSLRSTLSEYQSTSHIPMLIAVDEEGGTVCRVSSYSAFRAQQFYSPRWLYNNGGLELLLETETEKCQLLSGLGINVNMAPVCDITTDPSAFMYKRSLGLDAETTGQVIAQMVETMSGNGIGSVLKHFPGYGNNTDTHVGIAIDSRSLESLEETDLVPFQSGISANCGAVLVSHTIVECLDAELPASLSPKVHDYLRENMAFDGVIVTDDLVMDAISKQYGVGEAAVLAVLAGNDLLCSSDYPTEYEAILQAVSDGRISQELLDTAVTRILRWKMELGLI